MTTTLEDANASLRHAVETRLTSGCCEGDRPVCQPAFNPPPVPAAVHPTSASYFQLLEQLRDMHTSKSQDYGCPSGTDPLANIRNGATFVGIEPWRAAMVRLSDKVTRLATFNATRRLSHEGVEDNLLDLASYALLSLLLYQEEYPSK